MAYQRKTRDTWQLWVRYGDTYGWEHELTEKTYKAAREQAKTYRENCPEYPVQIRYRRERIAA